MVAINLRELKRQYELAGPKRTVAYLSELMDSRQLRADDFSVRDLFESLIENGTELLRAIGYRKSGGMRLIEAANAVDTSAFANITGQIVYNKIKERYQDPQFLWPELCETIPTAFLQGEKIPGIGRIGDRAEIVDEGQPFPTLGLSEEYLQTAVLLKRGFIVPVTREIIVADRTGILLREVGEGGYWLGLNKEKRILQVVLGITNNYIRNGTATNTYLTSGAYVNQGSTALVDWTSIQAAELLFDVITDPNTGELISVAADTLIVPSALRRTAKRILQASEVAHVDNQANPSTIRTFSPNPMQEGWFGAPYRLLTSSHIKEQSGSATAWWLGQPKRAFGYMEAWAIETLQAASNSEAEFVQDIMVRFKVSEMGVAQVLEPRFMVQGNT